MESQTSEEQCFIMMPDFKQYVSQNVPLQFFDMIPSGIVLRSYVR